MWQKRNQCTHSLLIVQVNPFSALHYYIVNTVIQAVWIRDFLRSHKYHPYEIIRISLFIVLIIENNVNDLSCKKC